MSISIIGTASDKKSAYDLQTFNKMVLAAKHMLRDLTDVTVVSGGAALGDHVAIKLFLEGYISKLILYFPCIWDKSHSQFYDNFAFNWKVNPGRLSNIYHRRFKSITGIDSLNEIQLAINKGAVVHVCDGFYARNDHLASSEILIAFTSGKNGIPNTNGTLYTWDKSTSTHKYHIDISSL